MFSKVVLAVSLFAGGVYADALSECNELASSLKQMVPMKIGDTSTWNAISCRAQKPKPILSYGYAIEVEKSQVQKAEIDSMKSSLLSTMCNSPEQRELLKNFDVEYIYKDKKGSLICTLVYTMADCKSK